jgi:hypothetical protein
MMACGRFSEWETDPGASTIATPLTALPLAQSSVRRGIDLMERTSPAARARRASSSAGHQLRARRYFVFSHHVHPAARAAFLENRANVEFCRAFADA